MENHWFGGVPVDWEGVCIQNGCVSSMEGLVHLLANPGDTVIVPGPCYSVFVVDWWVRCQTRLEAAHTSLETNFEPTIESLEAAYSRARAIYSKAQIIVRLRAIYIRALGSL